MRRLFVVVLIGIFVVQPISLSVAPAVATPETSGDSEGNVSVDVTVSRHNETAVMYNFAFDIPRPVEQYDVRLHDGAVVERSGFQTAGSPLLLSWTGDDSPTLTVIKRVETDSDRRCLCIATERWLLSRPIRTELTAVVDGRQHRTHLTEWFGGPTANASITTVDGRFTPGVVYFGPTDQRTASTDGARFRVIAPAAPDQTSADRVLDVLERGSQQVDLTDGPNASATLVVVPHTNGSVAGDGPNVLNARGITWSQGYAFVDGATKPETWLHEYVHTQENYTTAPEMEWFTEATAEYFGQLLGARLAGDSAEAAMAEFHSRNDSEAVLVDAETWGSQYVPYNQGGRLVAYLDCQIRNHTDGDRTFVDVYRRLNGRVGLSLAELTDAVSAVSGSPELAADLERYVTTRASPTGNWGALHSTVESADAPTETQQQRRTGRQRPGWDDTTRFDAAVGASVLLAVVALAALLGRRV